MSRLLPLFLFLLLGALLAVGLTIADRKTELPSPLIGKPMPEFTLPLLGQPDALWSRADLLGEPFLLNVWASWCVTCRVEHPVIESLANSGRLKVVGLNYRDDPVDAQAWLQHYGNPFALILADESGRTAIDFGVYAAPESFLVDDKGNIIFKHIGALTQEILEQEIFPRIERPLPGQESSP
jgi:cytochrome c biogenesis protein CcmG/thiol:disulfide interchange protein DsbE